MNSRLVLLSIVTVILSCDGWSPELIGSEDYEPMLSVLALLSPDQGGIVDVRVQRILPLDGSIWSGESVPETTWVTGEPVNTWERPLTKYEVTDAVVMIFDGANVYPFVYLPMGGALRYNHGYDRKSGRYVPIDSSFIPEFGETYHLSVETPDGLSLSGTMTIPERATILPGMLPDTLTAASLFTVRWDAVGKYYMIGLHGTDPATKWCIIPIVRSFDGDTQYSFSIKTNDCMNFWEEDSLKFGSLEISLLTLDQNYYNYFVLGPGNGIPPDDLQIILFGGGDAKQSYGVDGGLGIFGSFRIHTVNKVFDNHL